MKHSLTVVGKNLSLFRDKKKVYRNLQKHLNNQAVGYPRTLTGVEYRFLKDTFTTDEAEAALFMSYRFEPFEALYERAKPYGYKEDVLRSLLEAMEKKGAIFVKNIETNPLYAVVPFAVGMIEMQVDRLTTEIYMNLRSYLLQGFGMEYLTAEIPQVRTIPVQKSLHQDLNVSTYDEIREIVERTSDRISIAECICKKGKDMIGQPCKVTDRREVCMFFRDYHDTYLRHGWSRSISKEEAMEILDQNEKEGLMLMPSNCQLPQYVCACCSCCCGITEMITLVPRPADYAASNFHAVLDESKCVGCGLCKSRCHTKAIKFEAKEKKAKAIAIVEGKCIGCGLCVTACKTNALRLAKNKQEWTPPQDYDDIFDVIMDHKKGPAVKAARMAKAVMGMKKKTKLNFEPLPSQVKAK